MRLISSVVRVRLSFTNWGMLLMPGWDAKNRNARYLHLRSHQEKGAPRPPWWGKLLTRYGKLASLMNGARRAALSMSLGQHRNNLNWENITPDHMRYGRACLTSMFIGLLLNPRSSVHV